MKSDADVKKQVEELKVKLTTCFNPKDEDSLPWAKGFIAGLEWVLEK